MPPILSRRENLIPAKAGQRTEISLSQSSRPLFDGHSCPNRFATCLKIHQFGLASPGASLIFRTRLTRRSVLVKVPSSSDHDADGRMTSAKGVVSFRNISCTTRNSAEFRQWETCRGSGSVATRFSPKIQKAFSLPVGSPLIISAIFSPGFPGMLSTPQKSANFLLISGESTFW